MPGLVAAVARPDAAGAGLASIRQRDAVPRAAIVGRFGAGFAVGLRSQTLWLTGPLLSVWPSALLLWHRRPARRRSSLAASAVGALLWAVPLVWTTGGFPRISRPSAARAGGLRRRRDAGDHAELGVVPGGDGPDVHRSLAGKTLAHVVLGLALVWPGRARVAEAARARDRRPRVSAVPRPSSRVSRDRDVRYALPFSCLSRSGRGGSRSGWSLRRGIGATWLVAVSLAFATPRLDVVRSRWSTGLPRVPRHARGLGRVAGSARAEDASPGLVGRSPHHRLVPPGLGSRAAAVPR